LNSFPLSFQAISRPHQFFRNLVDERVTKRPESTFLEYSWICLFAKFTKSSSVMPKCKVKTKIKLWASHGRIIRGGHGLPKVSPEPTMPDPSMSCKWATPSAVFYPFEHPLLYARGASPTGSDVTTFGCHVTCWLAPDGHVMSGPYFMRYPGGPVKNH
jgi:hypothetical protein